MVPPLVPFALIGAGAATFVTAVSYGSGSAGPETVPPVNSRMRPRSART